MFWGKKGGLPIVRPKFFHDLTIHLAFHTNELALCNKQALFLLVPGWLTGNTFAAWHRVDEMAYIKLLRCFPCITCISVNRYRCYKGKKKKQDARARYGYILGMIQRWAQIFLVMTCTMVLFIWHDYSKDISHFSGSPWQVCSCITSDIHTYIVYFHCISWSLCTLPQPFRAAKYHNLSETSCLYGLLQSLCISF